MLAGATIVSGASAIITVCGYESLLASGEIDLVITVREKLIIKLKAEKPPLQLHKSHYNMIFLWLHLLAR